MPDTIEDYTNDDCPDGCSTDHDVDGTYFTCPETGNEWIHCYECGWTDDNGNGDTIRGRTYCSPSEHGYTMCDDCETWISDPHFTDDGSYCDSCYEDRDSDGRRADPRPYCITCSKQSQHFDLLLEKFICDCAVTTLLQGQPFYPVKMSSTPVPTSPPPPSPPPMRAGWRRAPAYWVCTAILDEGECGQPARWERLHNPNSDGACSEEHQLLLEGVSV
jgi:hypothetical protein